MTKSDWTSIIIMLAGPIEYWWDTPEEPDRFNSRQAREYRWWRDEVVSFFSPQDKGTLVYLPWGGFKGQWDERAQPINDYVVNICDVVLNLNPGVPAYGTDREIALAKTLGKPVYLCPPGTDLNELLQEIRKRL